MKSSSIVSVPSITCIPEFIHFGFIYCADELNKFTKMIKTIISYGTDRLS